jgi:hypothetical protein
MTARAVTTDERFPVVRAVEPASPVGFTNGNRIRPAWWRAAPAPDGQGERPEVSLHECQAVSGFEDVSIDTVNVRHLSEFTVSCRCCSPAGRLVVHEGMTPPGASERYRNEQTSTRLGLLALWCLYMLYFVVRGVDWRSCSGPTDAELGLIPLALVFPFALIAVGLAIHDAVLQRTIEAIPIFFRRLVADIIKSYHRTPRAWIVTTIILIALLWTCSSRDDFGRYSVHYYERHGIGFVRVEDHLLSTVTYQPTYPCPPDDEGD